MLLHIQIKPFTFLEYIFTTITPKVQSDLTAELNIAKYLISDQMTKIVHHLES